MLENALKMSPAGGPLRHHIPGDEKALHKISHTHCGVSEVCSLLTERISADGHLQIPILLADGVKRRFHHASSWIHGRSHLGHCFAPASWGILFNLVQLREIVTSKPISSLHGRPQYRPSRTLQLADPHERSTISAVGQVQLNPNQCNQSG